MKGYNSASNDFIFSSTLNGHLYELMKQYASGKASVFSS